MASSEWKIQDKMPRRTLRGPAFRALPLSLTYNNNTFQFDNDRHRFLEKFTDIALERNLRKEMYCISQHYELNYGSLATLYTLTFDKTIQRIKEKQRVSVKKCTCPYFKNENGKCKHMLLFQILYKQFQDEEDSEEEENEEEEKEEESEDEDSEDEEKEEDSEEEEKEESEDEDQEESEDEDQEEEDKEESEDEEESEEKEDDSIASRVSRRRRR